MPGDTVLSWERWQATSGNEVAGRGRLVSPYDWKRVESEQSPRGVVKLHGVRDHKPMTFSVGPGIWRARVRPRMSQPLLKLYLEGRDLTKSGDVEEGISRWRQLAPMADDPRIRSWIMIRIAEARLSSGDEKRAESAVQAALSMSQEVEERAVMYEMVGEAYKKQRNWSSSRRAFLDAVELRRKHAGESLGVAMSLSELGRIAMIRHDLDEAQAHFEECLVIRSRLAPGSLHMAAALHNLASVTMKRRDFPLAQEYQQQALSLFEKNVPDSFFVAAAYNNLGFIAHHHGDLGAFEDYLNKAFEINKVLASNEMALAENLNNLGVAALQRSDFARAMELYQQALAIKQRLNAPAGKIAGSLLNLGVTAQRQGELAAAETFFGRALKMYEGHAPSSLGVASCLANLGNLAKLRGEVSTAESYFRRSLTIREKLAPGGKSEISTLHALATLLRGERRLPSAASFFGRAADLLETRIPTLSDSRDVQADFGASNEYVYKDYVDLLMDLGRAEEAFHVLERFRARVLLNMLAERDVLFAADVPESLEKRRQEIALRSDRVLRQMASLNADKDDAKIEELQEKLLGLYRERDDLAVEVRRQAPRLADLRYPEPLDLGGVRDALDPGTVLLAYSVSRDRVHVFVVAGDFTRLETETFFIDEEGLRRRVEEFRRAIFRARDPRSFAATKLAGLAGELYAVLVEPVEAALARSRRVLIVPDGPLHRLPFGALIRRQAGQGSRYLLEWKPLHYALSATLYQTLTRGRGHRGAGVTGNLALFGDPRYPRSLRQGGVDEMAEPNLRAVSRRGLFDWSPLDHSRGEVDQIARLFGRGARTFLAGDATEEQVKSLDGPLRVAHFAVHGYYDDRLPLSSGLALSVPEGLSEGRDNGLLQAWEIFEDVRFDADLVVLSACSTALGHERGGEGLIGLTRAFQYAGARTVAASLWSVDDRATSELMVRFYRHLREGTPKDEALRAAQLELIRAPVRVRGAEGGELDVDASAPYYWAAFQLIGDWR